jgi:hypothetical protein
MAQGRWIEKLQTYLEYRCGVRRGLEYIDKAGVKHQPVASWSFVAADGVEMPLEEGTSCFM